NAHVAADDPAGFPQTVVERREASLPFRIVWVNRVDHADAPHPLALLRVCCQRPRCHPAAEKGDELPSLHDTPLRNSFGPGTESESKGRPRQNRTCSTRCLRVAADYAAKRQARRGRNWPSWHTNGMPLAGSERGRHGECPV